jgi:DNA-directed RNA polymerase subunit RPC12/RpoP
MTEKVKCNKCGMELNESSDIQPKMRTPCPSCGSISRLFEKTELLKIGIVTRNKIKGKRQGKGKPFIEQFSGKDLWHDLGRLVDKIMVIDRENDIYQEIIKDPINNIIIRYCLEPLSKHQDHGTAKNKT